MNLYEALGVTHDATAAEIKAAYRQMARTAHPDVGGSPEAFQQIRTAFDVLSDPARRERYDATGEFGQEADELEKDATSLIQAELERVLDEPQAKFSDVLSTIGRAFTDEIAKSNRIMGGGKRYRANAVDLQARFGGPKGDLAARFIERKIEQSDATMAGLERRIRVHKRALELLEQITFRREDHPMQRSDIWRNPDGRADGMTNSLLGRPFGL